MNATLALLGEEFKKFGPIKPNGIQVRSNRLQGFCFGFVEFEVPNAVQKMVEASPAAINGHNIHVDEKRFTNSKDPFGVGSQLLSLWLGIASTTKGCDGSVLIDSTKNNQAEKDGFPNLSLRGFQIIDAAKTAVEAACPGVVSCADILALVARDATYQIKGPYWPVPLGRRDGRVSIASESLTDLPSPFDNITRLKEHFTSKGLSVKDLVVLSGGHTVGTSHCLGVAVRLYNFTGKGDTDPSLDSDCVPYLKSKCKPTDTTTLIEMDPGSFRTFDQNYYTNVLKRRGLFVSDAALLNDYETSAYVKLQAESHGSTFLKDFQESMVKMGQIGVLTGSAGEIRQSCNAIN